MKSHAQPCHETDVWDEADAREFEDFVLTQDPVYAQAALWATRRTEGLEDASEAQFQDWLRADPQHAGAYEEMERSLDPVRELSDDKLQSLKEGLRREAAMRAPTQELTASTAHFARPAAWPVFRAHQPTSPTRRAWMAYVGRFFPHAATAVAAVALVSASWMGWDHWRSQPTFAKSYATARGQRQDIQLPDGSTLQLDAATKAEVRLYRRHREVRLVDGQALFAVHANPAQPFHVMAGAVRITVVGTRFSVRHTRAGLDTDKTVVAVESGRVRVRRMGSPKQADTEDAAGRVELSAGQGVTADETGRLEPVVSVPPSSVAGWRNGRITFNDTRLADALAELQRYGDPGLLVRDPAVGALRLGGSFDVRQIGAFAQALPSLLPVRLEQRNGVVEIVGMR